MHREEDRRRQEGKGTQTIDKTEWGGTCGSQGRFKSQGGLSPRSQSCGERPRLMWKMRPGAAKAHEWFC